MVIIQQDETEEQVVNPPQPAKSAKSSASSNVDGNKEASDGFETASDAELGSDGENDDDGGAGACSHGGDAQKESEKQNHPQEEAPRSDSSEVVSNSEDAKQVRFGCLYCVID